MKVLKHQKEKQYTNLTMSLTTKRSKELKALVLFGLLKRPIQLPT